MSLNQLNKIEREEIANLLSLFLVVALRLFTMTRNWLLASIAAAILLIFLMARFATGPVVSAIPRATDAAAERPDPVRTPVEAAEPRAEPSSQPTEPHAASSAQVAPVSNEKNSVWDQIPLDTSGESLGVDSEGHGKATPFNRALQQVAREEIRKCLDGIAHDDVPQDGGFTTVDMKIALSVEGTFDGYDIVDSRIIEGNMDAYRRRCLEIAFTKQLSMPGAGGEPGKRYKLEFPITIGFGGKRL